MEHFISLFILIPLLGFVINAVIPSREELRLSQVSFSMLGVQFVGVMIFTIYWLFNGRPALYEKQLVLLSLDDFELYIDFVFDEVTAVFLLIGAFIAFLITAYSRNYLHREEGFKRFFTTILFFYLGYNFIVLSGNLTTIFVGWEIAGVSSFLLIAYYRNRYIPVKNAIKIFSIYRLGDVALILAMWLGHHIWHQNISLQAYSDEALVLEHVQNYPGLSLGFAVCVLIAAMIKSAQFPFSAWLPRAMEGPTPSSAIFYSSLAVHLGVLVLLRTYSFWSHVPYICEAIICLGAFSFVLSTLMARIQPSIKGQISYSVVAQVGVIMIEVALGWHVLALIHFASHAMLRSYQILISPSVVSYAIKKQFFEFVLPKRLKLHRLLRNASNSIYILSLNEWYLDSFMYYLVWKPFKTLGKMLHTISFGVIRWVTWVFLVIIPVLTLLVGLEVFLVNRALLSTLVVGLAFLYVLRVFTEKDRLLYAWHQIACVHLFLVCGLCINGISVVHLSFYVGGIVLAYLVGQWAIWKLVQTEPQIDLQGYQGHCYEYPAVEFWFFVSCLGLMGFPITSAFVGMELLLNNVRMEQYVLLALLLLVFLVNGLAMIRIYARIFLGPHVKTYHTQARKSS